jgi:hypothetical protein
MDVHACNRAGGAQGAEAGHTLRVHQVVQGLRQAAGPAGAPTCCCLRMVAAPAGVRQLLACIGRRSLRCLLSQRLLRRCMCFSSQLRHCTAARLPHVLGHTSIQGAAGKAYFECRAGAGGGCSSQGRWRQICSGSAYRCGSGGALQAVIRFSERLKRVCDQRQASCCAPSSTAAAGCSAANTRCCSQRQPCHMCLYDVMPLAVESIAIP